MRRVRVVVAACIAIALLALTIHRVDAQPATFEDRAMFGGVDGEGFAVRAIGDQLWVGGEYSLAFDSDLVTSYPRANLSVFDFNTGEVLPFAADTDAKVMAIESDDASTVWVSGNFTTIRGQAAGHVAAFDYFGGDFSETFIAAANDDINAMLLHDGWLYLGGEFTSYNGVTIARLVRVDPVTGDLDPGFAPNPDGDVKALTAWGDRVYAVGLFEEVGLAPNQITRRWVAGFDVDTGAPVGPNFVLPPLGPNDNPWKAGVDSVGVSSDGAYLYTGDHRNNIIKWNRLAGGQVWSQGAEGDIQALALDSASLYLGTHDGWDAKGDQRLIVAIDAVTGARDNTWAPLLNGTLGVGAIDVADGAVIAVGEFTEVNGESSPHLVVFHSPSWQGADPLDPPPPELGDVNCDNGTGLGDALAILQYVVGGRSEVTTCPLTDPNAQIYTPTADVNGDLSVGLGDALMILQCIVGTPNEFCP